MKYRTKPFEIEALPWFTDEAHTDWFVEQANKMGWHDLKIRHSPLAVYDYLQDTWVTVNDGDYIIRGMKGEYYPCAAEVFEAKYEAVDE